MIRIAWIVPLKKIIRKLSQHHRYLPAADMPCTLSMFLAEIEAAIMSDRVLGIMGYIFSGCVPE